MPLSTFPCPVAVLPPVALLSVMQQAALAWLAQPLTACCWVRALRLVGLATATEAMERRAMMENCILMAGCFGGEAES